MFAPIASSLALQFGGLVEG